MSVNMRIMLPEYVTTEILKATINKSIGVLKENKDEISFYYDSIKLTYKGDSLNERKNKVMKSLNIEKYNDEIVSTAVKEMSNLLIKSNVMQNKKVIDTLEKIAKKTNLIDINEGWDNLSSGGYISMMIMPFEETNVMQSLVFSDYKTDDKIMPKGKFSVYLNPGSSCHWALMGHKMLEMFGGKIVWSDTKDNDQSGNFMIVEKKEALYNPNVKKSKEYNENLFKEALLKLKNIDNELLNKVRGLGFGIDEQSTIILNNIVKQENLYLKEFLEKEIKKNPPNTIRNKKVKF